MKRILFSLVMIAITVGVVTASAFALFSDKSDVKGVSISSGNANLQINGAEEISDASWFTDEVYPGWIKGQYFYLTNKSDSDISLDVTAQLSNATGDWDNLKNNINVALVEYKDKVDAGAAVNTNNPSLNATANTGWVSLANWNASAKSIGTSITHSSNHYFVFWSQVISGSDNTIKDKGVNTNWVLTATQK